MGRTDQEARIEVRVTIRGRGACICALSPCEGYSLVQQHRMGEGAPKPLTRRSLLRMLSSLSRKGRGRHNEHRYCCATNFASLFANIHSDAKASA
jgi:hypothetical protein